MGLLAADSGRMSSGGRMARVGGFALACAWALSGCGGGGTAAAPTTSTPSITFPSVVDSSPLASGRAVTDPVVETAAEIEVILADIDIPLVALDSAPSSESDPSTDRSPEFRSKVSAAVEERVVLLRQLDSDLVSQADIDPRYRTALRTEIAMTIAGLESLDAEVRTTDDTEAARRRAARIVTDHQVRVSKVPKVRAVTALAKVTVAAAAYERALDELRSGVDALQASGRDVRAERKALEDLQLRWNVVRETVTVQTEAVLVVGSVSGQNVNDRRLLRESAAMARTQRSAMQTLARDAKELQEHLRG